MFMAGPCWALAIRFDGRSVNTSKQLMITATCFLKFFQKHIGIVFINSSRWGHLWMVSCSHTSRQSMWWRHDQLSTWTSQIGNLNLEGTKPNEDASATCMQYKELLEFFGRFLDAFSMHGLMKLKRNIRTPKIGRSVWNFTISVLSVNDCSEISTSAILSFSW